MSLPTTVKPTAMTGTEFQELLQRTDLSRRQIAEKLETSHTNINNKCRADEVSALYEYAVRWLLHRMEEEDR